LSGTWGRLCIRYLQMANIEKYSLLVNLLIDIFAIRE